MLRRNYILSCLATRRMGFRLSSWLNRSRLQRPTSIRTWMSWRGAGAHHPFNRIPKRIKKNHQLRTQNTTIHTADEYGGADSIPILLGGLRKFTSAKNGRHRRSAKVQPSKEKSQKPGLKKSISPSNGTSEDDSAKGGTRPATVTSIFKRSEKLDRPIEKQVDSDVVAFKDVDPELYLSGSRVDGLVILLAKSTRQMSLLRNTLRYNQTQLEVATLVLQKLRRREIIAHTYRYLGYEPTSQHVNSIHNASRSLYINTISKMPELGQYLSALPQEIVEITRSRGEINFSMLNILPDQVIKLMTLRTTDKEGLRDLNDSIHSLSLFEALDCAAFYNRLWMDKSSGEDHPNGIENAMNDRDPCGNQQGANKGSNSLSGGVAPETPVNIDKKRGSLEVSDFCQLVLHLVFYRNEKAYLNPTATQTIVSAVLNDTLHLQIDSQRKCFDTIFPGGNRDGPFYLREASFALWIDEQKRQRSLEKDASVKKFLKQIEEHNSREKKLNENKLIANLQRSGEVVTEERLGSVFKKILPLLHLKKSSRAVIQKYAGGVRIKAGR